MAPDFRELTDKVKMYCYFTTQDNATADPAILSVTALKVEFTKWLITDCDLPDPVFVGKSQGNKCCIFMFIQTLTYEYQRPHLNQDSLSRTHSAHIHTAQLSAI
jgi:hypothetical protein